MKRIRLISALILFISLKIFSQATCGVGFIPKSLDVAGYTSLIDTIKTNYDFTQLFFNLKWASLKGIHLDTAYNDPFMNQWVVPQIHSNSIKLLICIDITDPMDRKKLNIDTSYHGPDTSFQQTLLKQAYVDEAFYIVKKYNPEYVALAVEIDEYLGVKSAAERTALLSAISETKDSIRKYDPAIKIFVYFQFENVKSKQLWNVIKPFADSSDYYGFSSYPSVVGYYGSNLPLDYYDTIATQWGNGKPIAFPEFAEPTDTSTIFPFASETNQRNFVNRFFSSVSDLNVSLINWVYLHDLYGSFIVAGWPLHISKYFGSMGLRHDTTGAAKQAFPYYNCQLLSINNGQSLEKNNLKVYPNPSVNGEVQLEFNLADRPGFINIYDITGACIKTISVQQNSNSLKITTEDISAGIYLIEITDHYSLRSTARFVLSER